MVDGRSRLGTCTEPDEAPAAYEIKTQAEIGLMFAQRLDDPAEDREQQRAYALRAIERCLVGLASIEDDFYHGFAAHMTIKLCLAAGERIAAKALYAGIRDPGCVRRS